MWRRPSHGAYALTPRIQKLLDHYGLSARRICPGKPHQNGVAEQANHRIKQALAQALLLRGSRDFRSTEEYQAFVRKVVDRDRNHRTEALLALERRHLRPLPPAPARVYTPLRRKVSRGSTLHIHRAVYSVAPRLISHTVDVRLHADWVEVYYRQQLVHRLPRLHEDGAHRIDYRHVIGSLVRKPGAFTRYRYKEDLFPSKVFRQAHARLQAVRADPAYVRILALAWRAGEARVEKALSTLLLIPGLSGNAFCRFLEEMIDAGPPHPAAPADCHEPGPVTPDLRQLVLPVVALDPEPRCPGSGARKPRRNRVRAAHPPAGEAAGTSSYTAHPQQRKGFIMANFYCDFSNQTSRTWTMCVYQTLPDSIGLDSVSWKQTTVPQSGFSGVTWEETYNVALAQYRQNGGKGVYTASQTLAADLGSAWDIVFKEGVQQLVRNGTTAPGQIIINNKAGDLANPGFGMSGQGSLYKRDTLSGSSAQFKVTISSNVVVGPFQLTYDGGKTRATVTATESGGSLKVDINYSQAASFSLESIQRKLDYLERLDRTLRAG
jgi:hypothetical protein